MGAKVLEINAVCLSSGLKLFDSYGIRIPNFIFLEKDLSLFLLNETLFNIRTTLTQHVKTQKYLFKDLKSIYVIYKACICLSRFILILIHTYGDALDDAYIHLFHIFVFQSFLCFIKNTFSSIFQHILKFQSSPTLYG